MSEYEIDDAEVACLACSVLGCTCDETIVGCADGKRVIETAEAVYMNLKTGSVGFESDWDNLEEVSEVWFDADVGAWTLVQ
jgi:hypothetical protein